MSVKRLKDRPWRRLFEQAIENGMTFGDAVSAFAERNTQRDLKIIELARSEYESEGECELDDPGCIVSEGDDNGAYVLAWMWVSFDGTDLSKSEGKP